MQPNITEDDFAAWWDHPVTQWVRAGLSMEAKAVRESWIAGAWDASLLDPIHKERAFNRWDILDHIATDLTFNEVQGYHESTDA